MTFILIDKINEILFVISKDRVNEEQQLNLQQKNVIISQNMKI